MNDLRKFKHGEESTHWACAEMVEKSGGSVACCHCNGHKCKDKDDHICHTNSMDALAYDEVRICVVCGKEFKVRMEVSE